MPESLKKKTVKGVRWSIIDNIGSRGITFIVGIILARLLTPQDYGLIGVVTIFIALFNCLVDSGFSQALIRQKDVDEADYNTVFFLNIAVSLFLIVILVLIAPIISIFYESSELNDIIQIMSVIVLLYSLSIVQRSIIIRNVDFKKQTIISLSASIISGTVGITMAFLGYGVWSLVWQQIIKYTVDTSMLWIVNRWIPSFSISIKRAGDLFGFGWKITLVNLIDAIWQQVRQAAIGKYSIASLGHYTRSKQFSDIFSENMLGVLNRVTYPVLSKIQDDDNRLYEAYTNVYRVTSFFCAIGLASLSAMSEPLVLALLGNKWVTIVDYIPILCLSSFFLAIHKLHMNIIKVKGDSHNVLKYDVFRKVLLLIPLLISVFYGLLYFLWGEVVVGLIVFVLDGVFISKMLNYKFFEQIYHLKNSILYASVFFMVMYILSFIEMSNLMILIIQTATLFISFWGLLWKKPNLELVQLYYFLKK